MEGRTQGMIPSMTLYAPHITPRLRYIVDFCGKELFDQPIHITADRREFDLTPGPRINYSREPIPNVFSIVPSGLLFESGIKPQFVTCFELNGRKAFFRTEGDFPFDIFSAAFYLLSRYEEYLPHEKDVYGRFSHTASLAWREGFLDMPLINYWLLDLREVLMRRFPELSF